MAADKLAISLGDFNLEASAKIFKVSHIFIHENYSIPYDHDIALLELERKVKFSKYIRPSLLPPPNTELPLGSSVYAVGWGYTNYCKTMFRISS